MLNADNHEHAWNIPSFFTLILTANLWQILAPNVQTRKLRLTKK